MDTDKIKQIFDEDKEFSGVIHITENNNVLINVAKGYAKRFDEIPNKTDTSLGIASGTKGFTALAILKLIDADKLNLDDSVFDILPYDFPNVKETITVRHLLSHTSGIYDYFDEDVIEDFGQLFTTVPINKILGPTDMLPLLTEGESYFSPGKRFKYCNSGFVVLGMLIEVVSKMSYSDYLNENIIKPLGLKGTGCYKTNELPKNCAHGYVVDDKNNWYSNIFEIPIACTADGGLYTTTDDVAKMWTGFLKGNLISEELKNEALKIQASIKDHEYYGLGFYITNNEEGNVKFYELVGCDPGVSFLTRYYVKEERIVTIISNTDYTVWDLGRKIKAYL